MFVLSDLSGKEIARADDIATLSHAAPSIIRWADTRAHCCLDIDDIARDCDSLIPLLHPVPYLAWVSRSGHGIHAMYKADSHYHADELAALAAVNLHYRYPEIARFELLRHTFTPSLVIKQTQVMDANTIERAMGHRSAGQDEIDQWLEARGMRVGNRYPHQLCPIEPSDEGSREPVAVYENGVYCHYCNHKGRGWVSFDQLCGQLVPSELGRMIRHKTHWEHARLVLQSLLRLPDDVVKRFYSAALIHRHGVSVREDAVFFPRRNLIRIGRWWGTDSGEIYDDKIGGLVTSLPAVQYRDDKGKCKIDKQKATVFQQTVDLSEYGYPSLHAIRGIRIYGQHLPYSNQDYSVVFHNEYLRRQENERFRPRYVSGPRDVEAAWQTIETVFPGVNRNVIRLLIAARGTAEGQIGLPPFLFASGPSGAAKSSSVMIAAAMVGDVNSSVVWINNMERVRQGILEAKTKGMYCTINEILKQARKEAVSFQTAMDDILNLTPESTSHQMYVGPVPLGILPVLVWTDTEVPVEIRESVQLARRLIHIHLPVKVEWETSIYQSGVYQIDRLRIASLDYARACDVILSDVIDEFFSEPNDLKTIARSMGFKTLDEEHYVCSEGALLEFYKAWESAPALSEAHARRWSGPGWKLIDLNREQDLIVKLWESLRDSENPKTSRRVSEANWPKIVGEPVEFESQIHGNRIAVRFKRY